MAIMAGVSTYLGDTVLRKDCRNGRSIPVWHLAKGIKLFACAMANKLVITVGIKLRASFRKLGIKVLAAIGPI